MDKLVKIKPSNSWSRVFTDEEQTAWIAAAVPKLNPKFGFVQEDGGSSYNAKGTIDYGAKDGVIVYSSLMFTLSGWEFVETVYDPAPDSQPEDKPSTIIYNNYAKTVVPNDSLYRVEHVKVREDCCTDELQRELKDGWHILAICPQPDQRRPDYVLGK